MKMTNDNSTYIGDGIYAGFDKMGIWLYANSHDEPTERIYLEPFVLDALIRFAKQVGMIK